MNSYNKTLLYYEEKVKRIKSYPIKNITLVAGSHKELHDYQKSSMYINCVKLYFEQHGYHVTLRLGMNPDDDLIFMSQASYFTPSGGGFSSLITELVKRNKGIVI